MRSSCEALRAAASIIRDTAAGTNPAPWFFDGYCRVWSAPMIVPHDEWTRDVLDEGPHTLERRGPCPACANAHTGCRHAETDYHTDPVVARVESHHGDTATGLRPGDGQHIAWWHPDRARKVADILDIAADAVSGHTITSPIVDALIEFAEDIAGARCPSCEHSAKYHQPDGCWFTVVVGRSGSVVNCACAVARGRGQG